MTVHRTALHGLVLWFIALIAIVWGYRLSMEQYLDQDWLSRAGCFVVVLGIWSGLGGVIEARLLHRALTIRKRLAMRQVIRAFGADEEEREKQLQKVQQKYDEKFETVRTNLGVSVGVIEASLLITGTIFWGFGDLIKYFPG